jgi:hypothetical protein
MPAGSAQHSLVERASETPFHATGVWVRDFPVSLDKFLPARRRFQSKLEYTNVKGSHIILRLCWTDPPGYQSSKPEGKTL